MPPKFDQVRDPDFVNNESDKDMGPWDSGNDGSVKPLSGQSGSANTVPGQSGLSQTKIGSNAPAAPFKKAPDAGPVPPFKGFKRTYDELSRTQQNEIDKRSVKKPKMADQSWVRMDTDESRNLVLKSKKTGNFLKNKYLIQQNNDHGTQNETWRGNFTHTQDAIAMAKDFAAHHPEHTPFTVVYQVHSKRTAAQAAALGQNTLPLVPYAPALMSFQSGGKRQKKREEIECGNCGRSGHLLADCVGPYSKDGDIIGCPVCNTRGHSFDECPHRPNMPRPTMLNFTIVKRGNKCQIRTDSEIYQEAVQANKDEGGKPAQNNLALPWTRKLAIACATLPQNIEYLRQYDYTKEVEGKVGIAADPTISWEKLLSGDIPSTSWSEYKNKKLIAIGMGITTGGTSTLATVEASRVPLPESPPVMSRTLKDSAHNPALKAVVEAADEEPPLPQQKS